MTEGSARLPSAAPTEAGRSSQTPNGLLDNKVCELRENLWPWRQP